MSSYTKEERFLIELYRKTIDLKNKEKTFDSFVLGKILGMSQRLIKTTIQILAQANFIKKLDNTKILLTEHGEKLVKSLLKS